MHGSMHPYLNHIHVLFIGIKYACRYTWYGDKGPCQRGGAAGVAAPERVC